ncbi:MAG: hypothetical protein WA863_16895, partial [Methyloceanibacter sp.]
EHARRVIDADHPTARKAGRSAQCHQPRTGVNVENVICRLKMGQFEEPVGHHVAEAFRKIVKISRDFVVACGVTLFLG